MYNTSSEKITIDQKTRLLSEVAKQLKQDFIGLDDIIDTVISLVTPWYLYPDQQKRPTIINLWGMTGVGKTSLVKRLVELLECSKIYYEMNMSSVNEDKLDVGRFLRKKISETEPYPFVICFDEFQYASTKNVDTEVKNVFLNGTLWELLDTGVITKNRDEDSIDYLFKSIKKLEFFVSKGVVVNNGYVSSNVDYYLSMGGGNDSREEVWSGSGSFGPEDQEEMKSLKDSDFIFYTNKRRVDKEALRFISSDLEDTIFNFTRDIYEHNLILRDEILKKNGEETIQFLKNVLDHAKSSRKTDCRQSLIFIIGNLDEAYSFSGLLSTEISADEFYRKSKKITVPQIKEALQYRFREEHIARLGNNHIIYPSLSSKAFKRIISIELNKITFETKENFGVELLIDASIHTIIYKEGVYPSQGTRPVYSTIHKLVQPYLVLIPSIIHSKQLNAQKVLISYKYLLFRLSFCNVNGQEIFLHKEKIKLNLEPTRVTKKDELQAVVAVHEAGHAIASVFLAGQIPLKIVSVSADKNEGFTFLPSVDRMVYNKQVIFKKAAICLAGLVAEELIFGEESKTSGSGSDLSIAKFLITEMVREQGLGKQLVYTVANKASDEKENFDPEFITNQEIGQLIIDAKIEASKVLDLYKPLLVDVAQYLANNTVLYKQHLQTFITKHTKLTEEDVKAFSQTNYRSVLFKNEVL